MSRQLVILGTSVTLPDPASVTELATSFHQQGGQLADLQTALQSLTRPDACGDWMGLAAEAFGQSIGQLPAEIGDVSDAYDDVASALQQYASQLDSVVSSLGSLSYQAEDAEGALAAVQNARSQAIANGQDPVTTGWNARVEDASAVVSALQGQLNRLLAELTSLAAACARQIAAAEPKRAGKSLFGELERDFVRDVADPLTRAGKETVKLAEDLVKLEVEADKLELFGAVAMFEALYIHPITNLWHDATKHLDPEQLGQILGDVAGVLGILALIPGVDAVAAPLMVVVSLAAAAAEWWAVADHEKGASVLQASLATLTFGLSSVGLVAKAAEAAPELADDADAAKSGENLWGTGLRRAFNPSDIKASISRNYELARGNAPTGLRGFGPAVFNNVRSTVEDTFTFPSGAPSSSPAAVTMTRVEWTADRLTDVTSTVQDRESNPTESLVP